MTLLVLRVSLLLLHPVLFVEMTIPVAISVFVDVATVSLCKPFISTGAIYAIQTACVTRVPAWL